MDRKLCVRVSEGEYEKLQKEAKDRRLNLSQLTREKVLIFFDDIEEEKKNRITNENHYICLELMKMQREIDDLNSLELRIDVTRLEKGLEEIWQYVRW